MAAVHICRLGLLLSLVDFAASSQALGATRLQEAVSSSALASFSHADEAASTMLGGLRKKALGATRLQEAVSSSALASFSHADEAASTMLGGLRKKVLQLLGYVVYGEPQDDFKVPAGHSPRRPKQSAWDILVSALLWVALSGAAAWYFKKYVKVPAADSSLENKPVLTQWSSGPFDCFSNMPICLWSFCCPAVRWAGTMEMVGLMSFWAAVGLFVSIEVVGMIPFLSIVGIVIPFVLTYFRNQIRVAFQIPGANEFGSMCGDCVFVTCCTCCAISQEARHVQLAAESNHEAVASQRHILEEAPAQAA